MLVLLLPRRLEAFELRDAVEALLRRPDVVAVDPPRTPYRSLARIPDALGVTIASKQARRLRKRLPGDPRALAIFEAAQYPLARSLLALIPECRLFYGGHEPEDRREAELHLMATERAARTFGDDLATLLAD